MDEPTLIKEDSAEELQEQILALQKKLDKAALEEQAPIERLVFPLARIQLKTSKNSIITVKNVSPPELAFLVCEHKAGSGGEPIVEIRTNKALKAELTAKAADEKNPVNRIRLEDEAVALLTNFEADARAEVGRLMGKYSQKKVKALYPSAKPNVPTTFREAMAIGMDALIPAERLMDYEVAKAAAV